MSYDDPLNSSYWADAHAQPAQSTSMHGNATVQGAPQQGQPSMQQPYAAGAMQQPYAEVDASQPGTYAQQSPANATSAYPPPAQSSQGVAIGALVCGILGVLLCLVPIVGGVLAIIAIILALVARKRYGFSGLSIAGLVTGIIGVLLAILFTFFAAWVIAELAQGMSGYDLDYLSEEWGDEWEDWDDWDDASTGNGAVSGTFDDPDDQAAYDAAVKVLDMVSDPDEQARQNLADVVNDGFKAVAGMDLQDVGIDPADIVDWTVADASYEVTNVATFDDGSGTVYYTSHVHDIDELIEAFSVSAREYQRSEDFKDDTDDQKRKRLGELMDEAMAADAQLEECYGYLDMEEFGGKWAPSKDSLDNLPNDFYGTYWG